MRVYVESAADAPDGHRIASDEQGALYFEATRQLIENVYAPSAGRALKKVYVNHRGEAPEGAAVKIGPRGGLYYETSESGPDDEAARPPGDDGGDPDRDGPGVASWDSLSRDILDATRNVFPGLPDDIDPHNARRLESLNSIAGVESGMNSSRMRVATMGEGEDSYKLFITKYDLDRDAAKNAKDASQVLGIFAPKSEYVETMDNDYVFISKEVPGRTIHDIGTEHNQSGTTDAYVDPEWITEAIAMGLLTGNRDMHAGNVMTTGEGDGSVMVVDNDMSWSFDPNEWKDEDAGWTVGEMSEAEYEFAAMARKGLRTIRTMGFMWGPGEKPTSEDVFKACKSSARYIQNNWEEVSDGLSERNARKLWDTADFVIQMKDSPFQSFPWEHRP